MSFDRLARHYRWLESLAFGTTLHRARIAQLTRMTSPQNVLIVGEGDGRFLSALVQAKPNVVVDCVDASEHMLVLARRRLERKMPGAANRVRFIQADVTVSELPNRNYDLLVTHFFLDCFDRAELGRVVSRLASAGAGNASWLVADFAIPRSGMRRQIARASIATMYRFFRLATGISGDRLIDPAPLLNAKEFIRARRQLFAGGMIYSDLWQRASTL